MKQTLIIFVKNPVEGQVKTRLAATVGHQKAVEIYRKLLVHTQKTALNWQNSAEANVSKRVSVFYGDFINENDLWNDFDKYLQVNGDLGQRMYSAFADEFYRNADQVAIIGSDCLQLTDSHIKAAFGALITHNIAIGPAQDGGYYLLGMMTLYNFLFENKPWSQPQLLTETMIEIQSKNIDFQLLDTLSDIDTWEDYLRFYAV
jgi:uncharacterized protein